MGTRLGTCVPSKSIQTGPPGAPASQPRRKAGGCGGSKWELAFRKAWPWLQCRALGNLALSFSKIWLLTLNDFLSYDVLCYLARNKSRMLSARLSLYPSLFLKLLCISVPPTFCCFCHCS